MIKFIIICYCFLFGNVIKGQLEGGLLGILKPEGAQISIPAILGLAGRKTTTTTTTTTTPTTTTTTTTIMPASSATTSKTKKTTETPTCGYTPTISNGKRSCKGKLIFQENFAKIVNTKWLKEIRFAGEPDYEFTVYQNNDENLFLAKRTLHIRPSLTDDKYGIGFVTGEEELNLGDACTGEASTAECVQKPRAWQIIPPTISGMLTTRRHFSFLHGIVEIRAKLPQGDWIYPELYLKPKSNFYGTGYESGLIRIAFVAGNEHLGKNLSAGVFLSQSEFGKSYGIKTLESHVRWTRDFHTFKVEWKPDGLKFSVDDEVYAEVTPPEEGFVSLQELELGPDLIAKWKKGSILAPLDKEMYLVLGVGVGGQLFPDTEDSSKPWENNNPKGPLQFYRQKDVWSKTWNDNSDLVVDYVKIWAL
ncbi:hypothetical protein FQA39_LY11619 [Lamprigera yunnana]|nr:hypothetical protein FQA39_LY11619 [Lamprigera yunnana]